MNGTDREGFDKTKIEEWKGYDSKMHEWEKRKDE